MKILCFVFFYDSPQGDLHYRLAVTMPKEKTCVSKLIHSKFHFRILRTLADLRGQSVLYITGAETLSPLNGVIDKIKIKKSRPSWTLEIQRNIRNFRTECHIPLQLTEPSLPECLPSGSAAQWEQIARDTKSDTGDRGGGQTEETVSGRCSQTITSPICQ